MLSINIENMDNTMDLNKDINNINMDKGSYRSYQLS